MARTKGSKNKSKTVAVDYAAQIAEEQAAKDAAIAELANAETAVDDLMAQLADLKETVKAKKANIKCSCHTGHIYLSDQDCQCQQSY